ncbi:hypothetical protein LSAT2_028088 [Lamellibrachia satsuma]|nr:hypothetical protein LSAT2_028088 [Lamellibrachia satsuma]
MMASSATGGADNLATVHSSISAISTGEIQLEDKLQGEKPTGFINVSLEDNTLKSTKTKKKVPRRIIHFSDGIVEEYSTDEEDEIDNTPKVDPKTLTWLPWFWYYTINMSFGALSAVDFCGEKLAWLFGITSPKYQYAIDEYNRLEAEEKEEMEREEREKEAIRQRALKAMSDMEGGTGRGSTGRPNAHSTSHYSNTCSRTAEVLIFHFMVPITDVLV